MTFSNKHKGRDYLIDLLRLALLLMGPTHLPVVFRK
jgi:hypothetical protein